MIWMKCCHRLWTDFQFGLKTWYLLLIIYTYLFFFCFLFFWNLHLSVYYSSKRIENFFFLHHRSIDLENSYKIDNAFLSILYKPFFPLDFFFFSNIIIFLSLSYHHLFVLLLFWILFYLPQSHHLPITLL